MSGPDVATIRRLVAIPSGATPRLHSVMMKGPGGNHVLDDSVVAAVATTTYAGLLRDQPLAWLTIDVARLSALAERYRGSEVEFDIVFDGASGPASLPTGPMGPVCARAIENYALRSEDALAWRPRAQSERSTSAGTVSYCTSVSDCATSGVDILFIAAASLASTPSLHAYAVHHADYYGLNVGIMSTSDLSDLTPETLRQTIRDVYETQSAAHFGDGHLGFVLLIGDAYADDNESVMIPAYYGYGGTESASDHYYACVSGDDEFEDVMLGRLSVGNLEELQAVVTKSALYMPQVEGEEWHERVLLIGGLFYTIKDDYVALFDQYDAIIPDDLTTDRIYRHDYSYDQACALDVVDAINSGYLFVNFNGDGWLAGWHRTMNVTHIPLLQNSNRLPVILSMACNTGRFDNTTEQDVNGSYDSLAEQLLNAPGGGGVAVVAASRASDGGIFRTFTKDIYRAAFEQNCVFIGEMMATAKLLHVQELEDPTYARQFNLFGDPSLMFRWDFEPEGLPDLAVKPYQTLWNPDFASSGDDISVDVTVVNQSAMPAQDVLVRLAGTSDLGTYTYDTTIPEIGSWSAGNATFLVQQPVLGSHTIEIIVDPNDAIEELDESNNGFEHTLYVYPGIPGFPVETGVELHSPCVATGGIGSRLVLVPDDDARLWALDKFGETAWVSNATWGASFYGPEIAASSGDLDGDGENEIIHTKFMGVVALDHDGDVLWTENTDDPVGYPVLADVDSDGDLDVVLSTRAPFGGQSSIVAIDENGDNIWSHPLATGIQVTTTPIAGDFDLDGHIDIAYGTSDGGVEAVSCAENPPSVLWGPVNMGETEVVSLGLADLDLDGYLEIAVAGDGVRSIEAESGSDRGSVSPLDGEAATSLAISDVDGDGRPEIVAGTAGSTVGLIDGGVEVWTRQLSGTPGSSATIADIDGSGTPKILIGTDAGYLHILNGDGSDFVSPIPVGDRCLTPFAYDLTGDNNLDVVVSTSGGVVYAFTFGGGETHTTPDWLGLAGDATRASILEQPFWGTIDGNLLLCGNFHMTDDLVVPSGSTLTIASGSHLVFDDASLEISGSMNASGIPGSEVVMTSYGARERWRGIETMQGSSITLYSCVVTNADTGLEAHASSVYLVDCGLEGNGAGARIEGGTLYASGTSFSGSDGEGLSLEGGSGSILDCVADGNGTAGLIAYRASAYHFLGSSFTGTLDGSGAEFRSGSGAAVDSCSFSGNSQNGALVRSSAPSFTGCLFDDNGLYGVQCERLSFPSINWSTVTGNRIGVLCQTSSFPNLGDDMVLGSGFNSIHGNQQAAVANQNSEPVPVYARRNWWGADPPAGRIFMGYVIYLPWLSEEPDPGLHGTDVSLWDVPGDYGLSQNAPNPFNPTTAVGFSVPYPGGDVRIAVYDAAGRLVRVLQDGPAAPGAHTLTWDGRDGSGNRVASGIYFARMVAPDFEAARKMLLIK